MDFDKKILWVLRQVAHIGPVDGKRNIRFAFHMDPFFRLYQDMPLGHIAGTCLRNNRTDDPFLSYTTGRAVVPYKKYDFCRIVLFYDYII